MRNSSDADLISTLRRLLDGARSSGKFTYFRCPVHKDTRASASVWLDRTRQPRAKCFAGCSEQAVLLGIERQLGMPLTSSSKPTASQNSSREAGDLEAEIAEARRAVEKLERVNAIWSAAAAVSEGDPVHRYLRETRGLELSQIPEAIRYYALLHHGWSRTDCAAMVAQVQDAEGEVVGIHRTWLDGWTATKASLDPNRAALGTIKGGAIRLHDVPDCSDLVVGEGIETTLAAAQLSHWRCPAWAAISSSGMEGLIVPARFKRVVIAADHDDPGEKAAMTLAHRLRKRGMRVVIKMPPAEGEDWNDVVLAWRSARRSASAPSAHEECVA